MNTTHELSYEYFPLVQSGLWCAVLSEWARVWHFLSEFISARMWRTQVVAFLSGTEARITCMKFLSTAVTRHRFSAKTTRTYYMQYAHSNRSIYHSTEDKLRTFEWCWVLCPKVRGFCLILVSASTGNPDTLTSLWGQAFSFACEARLSRLPRHVTCASGNGTTVIDQHV